MVLILIHAQIDSNTSQFMIQSMKRTCFGFHQWFYFSVTVIVFAASRCSGGSQYVMQFEDITGDNATIRQITYYNNGFQFSAPGTPSGGLIFCDSALVNPNPPPGYFVRPVNGSKYLASFTGSTSLLKRIDGMPFTLYGVDLAEYSSAFAEPQSVTVTGTFSNGGTIQTILGLDGHVDGLPVPPDFQTFTFSSAWTGLTRVTFLITDPKFYGMNLGASFDNFVLSAVPEPASFSIIVLGFVLVGFNRRARNPSIQSLRRF